MERRLISGLRNNIEGIVQRPLSQQELSDFATCMTDVGELKDH
jgi:hypothetical protein